MWNSSCRFWKKKGLMGCHSRNAKHVHTSVSQFGWDFLYGMFPRKQISKGDIITRPPPSPELTPHFLFLSKYVQDAVYIPPLRRLHEILQLRLNRGCKRVARVPKITGGHISLARIIQCCPNVFYFLCPTSVSIL